MSFYYDIALSVGTAAVALLVLRLSGDLGRGAAQFPLFIAVALGLLSLGVLVKAGINLYRRPGGVLPEQALSGDVPAIAPSGGLRTDFAPLIAVAFCLLFSLLFTRIWFELAASGLIFGMMFAIQRREALRRAYLAVAAPVPLILIFSYGLKIRLHSLIVRIVERLLAA